jgi:hypothetical protein
MDSKTVFELRNEAKELNGINKANKLNEALEIANNLYQSEPYDEWNQKAFAWILIDLCKYYIPVNNLNQALIHFNQLNSIQFDYPDDIIESQKKYLKPKIDTNYQEINKAEELSKSGKNQEALAIFKNLISQNRLSELHHESYGWVIYRYIKAEESNLSSVEVRTFFRDYMNLKNERPSMLHSMILNFALNYSKTHNDFKFYNFFLLWNPNNLRHEDLHNGYKDGKEIPSLISRICREFVNSNTEFSIEEFLSKIDLNKETVLDFFRETLFWNIFNTQKENKFSELWNLFEQYNNNYSKYEQSKWHSEILNLAERFMKENEEWRFLSFFKNWNPENLRPDDWKEVVKDENTYKPLANKCLKKASEILKTQTSEQNLSWLIQPYEIAIKLFPNDEWLLREKALLHFKNNELELVIKIYKQLVLELSNKHYVWQEFSNCIVSDNSIKIGMLSKALSLEKNEDFLGDIHLDLASVLIDENLIENALIELESYKRHREIKGWKLSLIFNDLHKKAGSVELSVKDNHELYKTYIPFAEDFAYVDFEWTEVVLADKWKDKKGKERLTFTDGKTIEFVIGKNRFEVLKKMELGTVLKFKLHKQEIKREVEAKFTWSKKTVIIEHKYIPLLADTTKKVKWSILDVTTAIVVVNNVSVEREKIYFAGFIKSKPRITQNNLIQNNKNLEESGKRKRIKKGNIAKFVFNMSVPIISAPNISGEINFSEVDILPNSGDFLELTAFKKTNKKNNTFFYKPINVKKSNKCDEKLLKEFSGNISIFNEQPFGFLDDVFVPPNIINEYGLIDQDEVTCKAILAYDSKKESWGWKAHNILT